MTRIFWDTHLFLYLFEGGTSADDVKRLRERMLARGDRLFTSSVTMGEVLVRPVAAGAGVADVYETAIARAATILPFDATAARHYAALRAEPTIDPTDAMQLSCAAAAGSPRTGTKAHRRSSPRRCRPYAPGAPRREGVG